MSSVRGHGGVPPARSSLDVHRLAASGRGGVRKYPNSSVAIWLKAQDLAIKISFAKLSVVPVNCHRYVGRTGQRREWGGH